MATTTESLILDIIARDKGSQVISNFTAKVGGLFSKLGNQIGGELGNALSTVGQGLDSMGAAAPRLGSQLQAIGIGALAAGTALKALGSSDQQAQAQLKAAIEATGGTWSDYAAQIDVAIKAGENFAHTADQTQNALQTLTSATHDPARALANMALVEDLAAARHFDLNDAALIVARTLNGNTRILKQYGIATDGVSTSVDVAQQRLNQLAGFVAGQAKASVSSFTGALDVFKAKAMDLASSISGPLGSGLQGLGAGLALVGTVMESGFIQKTRAAMTAADGFKGKISSLKGVLIGGAGLTAAIAGISLIMSTFAEKASRADAAVAAFTSGDSSAGLKAVFDQLNRMPGFVERTQSNVGFFQSLKRSSDVLKETGHTVQEVQSHLNDSDSAWAKYKQSLLDASDAARNNGSSTTLLRNNLDDLRTSAQAAKTQADALGISTDGLTASQVGIQLALKKSADAFNASRISLSDYYAASQAGLIATYDARDAYAAAAKGIKDLGKKHKESAADVEASMRTIVEAAGKAKDAQSNAALGASAFAATLETLRDKTKPGSPLRKAIDGYITSLGLIPGHIDTKIHVTVPSWTFKPVYTTIGGVKTLTGEHPQGGGTVSFGAQGGIIKARPGGMLLVAGEGGRDEALIPLPRKGGGLTGNTTYMTINITKPTDPVETIRLIQQYERRNGSGWRK